MTLHHQMRELGLARHKTLHATALDIAAAAKRGEIDQDDAERLYLAYFMASAGITNPDRSAPSIKANVSKLRQIIKAADPELVRQVIRACDAMAREGYPVRYYASIVAACRRRLTTGRRLTTSAISKIIAG